MTYSIFPRSLDSSGRVYFGKDYGINRTSGSMFGHRSARSTRPNPRRFIELSWEGVPLTRLAALDALMDTTMGVGLIVMPSYRRDALLTQAYDTAGGAYLYVDDTTPFTSYTITITDSINDRLDFSVDGSAEKTAILTPGAYTPANLAIHIKTQMEAMAGGPHYIVYYSINDDRFTIAEDSERGAPTGILELWFFTGTNAGRTVGATLGFDVSRNRAGVTTYSSAFFLAPYGSRVFLGDKADGYASNVLRTVTAVDSVNKRLTIETVTGHTYAVGSIVEPVFNGSFAVRSNDGEAEFGFESMRGARPIVSTSVRIDQEFNA